jgi:haloalkane dehalogenase
MPAPSVKKTALVRGHRMAYVEDGAGAPIVFQHGNGTSSYLWRNVLPHVTPLGRAIACDLIGMGDSDKLLPSGPDRYDYFEHRDYLFALWEQLGLDRDVILVLHSFAATLGFEWARWHPDRVAGIVYLDAVVKPLTWDDVGPNRDFYRDLRSDLGEELVLDRNLLIEGVLPSMTLRTLTEHERAAYRAPFVNPGEDRRPMLSWSRQLPIDGEPAGVVKVVEECADWLSRSPVPKLFINTEPGSVLVGRSREFCRTWPNQTEVTVRGRHFAPEDSPDQIGAAIADFVRAVRAGPRTTGPAR